MKIKELDWSTVPDSAVVVCIGRRKSGKTVNIIDIFYKKRNKFKMGLVFCGSKATIKQYEKHFPGTFIYDGYHSDVVGAVIDKQERDVEMGKAQPIFILVDDCMWAKKSIIADPNIRRLFMNGRHSLIFFVLSMQYSMDIPPSLRQQIDFTLLNREKNPQNRERLFRCYNVCFRSFDEFDRCMMSCTLDHETFVLSNGSETDSDKAEDNVFWWKAKYDPNGRKFRVNKTGTWWDYHLKKFNSLHFDKTGGSKKITKISKSLVAPSFDMIPTSAKSPTPPEKSMDALNPLSMMQPLAFTHNQSATEWMERQRHQNMGARVRIVKDDFKHV